MSGTEKRVRPIWWTLFLAVMMPLALFYLFIVPMLAAAFPREMGVGEKEGLPPLDDLDIGILRRRSAKGEATERLHAALRRDFAQAGMPSTLVFQPNPARR